MPTYLRSWYIQKLIDTREAEIQALRNHSQVQAGTVLQKEEE